MSFYHLPNPWDPHYAIPRYVLAEPPERGTFTTQWLPRGTIPQVVPDFLAVPQRRGSTLAKPTLAEHSLKGSSLHGSSLHGDSLGASRYELEPLGATAASFPRYGQKVARDLVRRMQALPAKDRANVMRRTLAAIDKTLPARAEKFANEARARGVPVKAALETGIARALSQGAVAEIAALGRRGRLSPQSGSLRGLGRAPTSLGATAVATYGRTDPYAETKTTTTTLQAGQCDPQTGLMWTGTAWRRATVAEIANNPTCKPPPPPAPSDPTAELKRQALQCSRTPDAPECQPVGFRAVQVGPFQFPADQSWSGGDWWGKKLPADWQGWIRRVIGKGGNVTYGSRQLNAFIDVDPKTLFNNSYVGTSSRTPSPTWTPVARAKHPDSGKDYGVFLSITYRDPKKAISDPTNIPILHVIWAPIQKSRYEAVWDWIEDLAVSIVDVIGDAVNAVKDATCQLLTQPGVEQAAISAAATAPTPTTAGVAAGVVIGQQLCGGAQQQPPPQLPPQQQGGGWMVPLAIAGGGLLLVLALARR